MPNPFKNRVIGLSGPATDLMPIVPSDQAALAEVAVSLFVETGGALAVVTVSGETRTVNVPDFSVFPVGVTKVLSTGTTASGIHGFIVDETQIA
jgi:uncharacterized protein YggE